jgi:hypothetical protein
MRFEDLPKEMREVMLEVARKAKSEDYLKASNVMRKAAACIEACADAGTTPEQRVTLMLEADSLMQKAQVE